jgi:transmembrane sensor
MGRQGAESIEDEAAEWVARLDRHGHSPALKKLLDEWLAGDTRREGALVQARAAWKLINDQIGLARREEPAEFEFPAEAGGLTRRRALWAGGAAIAASLIGGLVFTWSGRSYETTTGEIRRMPLADGSIVALNTETKLAVMLGERARVVRIDRGEAFFQVAKDRTRPFTAEAGKIRVRAVGTAFSVRLWENGADVLVSEGVVEAWTYGAEGNLIRISAGHQAFIANDAGTLQNAGDPAAIDRALAWRSGQIDLAGDPLSHAVAEFNRYNMRKIVLTDESIGVEPLYGIFRTDDPKGFAEAIHQGFGASIDYSVAGEIRIGRPKS